MNENKFDGMGKIYSEFRPGYPQSFIEYLYNEVGISEESIIADIGSGTGKLTEQLLRQGNTVYAVEPNSDMRKIADDDLSRYKKFISVNGSAENTTLGSNSVDFITVAQAFHWFDRYKFKKECNRILKSDGKVILVWNSRDENSEIVDENDKINSRYCPNYKGFSGGMQKTIAENDFSDFFIGKYEINVFENPISFDNQGFVGRNLSSSYALKADDKEYNAYVVALEGLFDKYSKDGIIIMPNFAKCYIGNV